MGPFAAGRLHAARRPPYGDNTWFKCRVAAKDYATGDWQFGGWKSHDAAAQTMSQSAGTGDWFTKAGFEMKNTKSSAATPGTADSNKCWHKDTGGDITTITLTDTVAPTSSVPAADFVNNGWYKDGDQITADISGHGDTGSGVYSIRLEIGPHGGVYQFPVQVTCNPSYTENYVRPKHLTASLPVFREALPALRWDIFLRLCQWRCAGALPER